MNGMNLKAIFLYLARFNFVQRGFIILSFVFLSKKEYGF